MSAGARLGGKGKTRGRGNGHRAAVTQVNSREGRNLGGGAKKHQEEKS